MSVSAYYQPRTHEPCHFSSTGPADETLPVVVAGAGPVGMAVAVGLAQRGIRVTVLEAADQVSFGSRAICICFQKPIISCSQTRTYTSGR